MPSNPRDQRVTQRVVKAVAERTNTPADDLPVLQDVIEGEALNRLVEAASTNGTKLTVQFTYAGFSVQVDQDGSVTLTEPRDSD